MSDNAWSADNQQERSHRVDAKSSETIRQTIIQTCGRLKIESELHGDMQKPAETSGSTIAKPIARNRMSEIPCRVSSDLHERRNDFPTVSNTGSAKLNSP